jgi:hypothetical protein
MFRRTKLGTSGSMTVNLTACPLVTGATVDRTPAGRTSVDDGASQIGAARSYTVLTTGNYSGTKAITINGKTDTKSNNCVQDNVTGLMWTRYPSATLGPSSNGRLKWYDSTSHEDIFQYCDECNTQAVGGHSDWRVPNILELISIALMSGGNAQPDTTAWPSGIGDYVYCSTSTPDNTAAAMQFVPTSSGHVTEYTKTAAVQCFCMLVRG